MFESFKSSNRGDPIDGPVSRERSIGDIFKDMVSNIQEIVRCEIRLVKADIKQEAGRYLVEALRYLPHARLLLAGTAVGVFGVGFLLLSAVYGLALVMPIWAAAALIGFVLSIASTVMINTGLGHWRKLYSVKTEIKETIKENTTWSNHPAK